MLVQCEPAQSSSATKQAATAPQRPTPDINVKATRNEDSRLAVALAVNCYLPVGGIISGLFRVPLLGSIDIASG